jgi:hypothetical protein
LRLLKAVNRTAREKSGPTMWDRMRQAD